MIELLSTTLWLPRPPDGLNAATEAASHYGHALEAAERLNAPNAEIVRLKNKMSKLSVATN